LQCKKKQKGAFAPFGSLGTAAVGDLDRCVCSVLTSSFRLKPARTLSFCCAKKKQKGAFSPFGNLRTTAVGDLDRCVCSVLTSSFRLKPAWALSFCCAKKKQKGAFSPFGSLGTTATSDTGHTPLYGRSNSLREFCSRAQGFRFGSLRNCYPPLAALALPQRSPRCIRTSTGDLIPFGNSAHVPVVKYDWVQIGSFFD